MSDVEYYLLEKDGENSKCGVLDLGKCMDSDENSAGESTFPKETSVELQHTPPATQESLEENRRENNTTNLVGHTQESKGSDDQILRFISTQESCPDVSPNRDAQVEKDMNVCKSPDNMLKDLIDMNVGVSLSTESLHGNGVNPEEKSETAILKQAFTDASNSSSVTNTNPHSTKIQAEVADNHPNSKSLTEILDDFCNEPTEIMTTSEMSFSALVENDEKEKPATQNNQLQNQEVEMTEIWSGENTEEVIENGTVRQAMKEEELKESNAGTVDEEVMETEEDEASQIDSSLDSNETEESEIHQIGSSEKSVESEIFVDGKEIAEKENDASEGKVADEENEEEMETVENEVEDKQMEEEVNSKQDEADDNEMVDKNMDVEENEANDNRTEENALGSPSEDAVERDVKDREMEMEEKEKGREMEMEEKESVDEELKGIDTETQEKDTDAEEVNSAELEGSQGIKEHDGDEERENQKKTDDVSEDTESDLADDDVDSRQNSLDLIDKERNISEDTEDSLADDDMNLQEKSVVLIDNERNMDNEKEKINDRLDLGDEEENSQDEDLQEFVKGDHEENLEHQSSELMSSKESEPENINTISKIDKNSSEKARDKSPDVLENVDDVEDLDAEHKDQDKINKEKSVKIQVSSRSSEVIVESETKTSSSDKNLSKETELSETGKEIFEGSEAKSVEKVVETGEQVSQKSTEAVSSKENSKVSDANALVLSSDGQSNADDDFVDYDEESIENISKTIKSFTSESSLDKKKEKNDSSKKADPSQSKQVIMVKTSSNVERVKRKLEEILEKSKGEEDAAIAELQRMKKEKTDILNAITTEMEKLKAILVKGKQG